MGQLIRVNLVIIVCTRKFTHLPFPFDAFANRADPGQVALVRAVWSVSTLFANGHIIRYDPILEDLTSNFVVLYINVSLLIKVFIVCEAQHEYSCGKGLNNFYAH